MIASPTDPSTMPPDARLDEVADILALGYLRLLKSRDESQKELDDLAEHTALHGAVVNGGRAARKESA